jgi:phage-related protein
MSSKLAEIIVALKDRASRSLNAINARFERVGKAASNFGAAVKSSMKIIAGVAAGAGALVMLAKASNDAARKVADAAGRYQVSAQTLQVAGSLAESTGASFEDAASSIGKLKKSQNEAIHGNKELAAAFKGVGISVEELKKMTPEQILRRMADAFKGSNNDLAKQAVLLKLMGKNGESMMNVLNEGGEAWQQRLKEMTEDGALFSEEQLKETAAFDDAWNRISNTFKGLRNSLGISLAKTLLPVIDQLREWVNANRELIQSKFQTFLKHLPSLIETVTKILTVVWKVVEKVGAVFEWLGHLVGMQGVTWITFAAIIGKPVLMFGNLMLTILSLLPSLKTVTKVFSWLGKGALALGKTLASILLPALKLVGKTVLWLGRALLMNPIGLAVTAIAGAAYLIYRYWEPIKGFFSSVWERVKEAFSGGISGVGKLILDWSPLGLFYKAFAGVLKFFDIELPESFSAFGSKMIENLFAGIREKFEAGKRFLVDIKNKLAEFFGFGETPKPDLSMQERGGSEAASLIAGAAANKQDIKNTLSIKIDSEGRPTVTEMKSSSPNTNINVNTGPLMAGA